MQSLLTSSSFLYFILLSMNIITPFSPNCLVHSNVKFSHRNGEKASCPLLRRRLLLPAEDALVLQQYELHNLVLVHHVDRYVARFRLGPQQGGPEHDGHALGGHAVGLPMVNHPEGEREREVEKTGKVSSGIIS